MLLTIEQTDKIPTSDGKSFKDKYEIIKKIRFEEVENPNINAGDVAKMTLDCSDLEKHKWLCHRLKMYKDASGTDDLEGPMPEARFSYTSSEENLTVTIRYNIHDAVRILHLMKLISESAKNQITECYKDLCASYLQQAALRYAEAVLSPEPAARQLTDKEYMEEQVIPLVKRTLMKEEGNAAIAGPASPPVKAH